MSEDFIPTVAQDTVYNYLVIFDDTGHNADVRHGIAEMFEWNKDRLQHKVRRPTADNLSWSLCVGFPGARVSSDADKPLKVAAFMRDNRPVIAGLTADSDVPTLGCSLGTVKDKWGLKVGNTGFVCTGVINDTAGARYVYVRPVGGGGGGAFSLAQATADGTGGTVKVKAIQHLTNLSASPNFEQTGAEFTVKYFKL